MVILIKVSSVYVLCDSDVLHSKNDTSYKISFRSHSIVIDVKSACLAKDKG